MTVTVMVVVVHEEAVTVANGAPGATRLNVTDPASRPKRSPPMVMVAPGPALPGDYDFARAAWFQGLGAVGYAIAAPEPVTSAVEAPLGLRVTATIARLRQAIGRRVVEALPGQAGAIANALITGQRS